MIIDVISEDLKFSIADENWAMWVPLCCPNCNNLNALHISCINVCHALRCYSCNMVADVSSYPHDNDLPCEVHRGRPFVKEEVSIGKTTLVMKEP